APPTGYSYRCGDLCYDRNAYDGFSHDRGGRFYDRNASSDDYFNFEDYNNVEDYSRYDYSDYDSYNSSFMRLAPQLWVFVPTAYFSTDDYSETYFEPELVQYLFTRRIVRITSQYL